MKNIKRGDILYIDLGQHGNSSVQSGMRPCIVLSNNISNRYSTTLCVCPFSGKIKENPVHVKVKPSDVKGYFLKESDCLAEQIVTVDKRQIVSKVGHIPEDSDVMKAISKAVCMQLSINNSNENK
ncbi:MAG: type II toxin-antitoxin system PemK/MazF family toxin [Alphaproteobacteria bacterium]|nr:type II toxin-antitoxin system PemK/MazF family toxin [Alphaproteobacteria bacterium]